MKNFLNVIADILTLVALSVAAVGHVLNWYDFDRWYRYQPQRIRDFEKRVDGKLVQEIRQPALPQGFVDRVMESQHWHATNSGAALGALAFLVMLSLVFPWGAMMRRLLNLLMFGAAFTALLFEVLFVRGLETPDGLPAGLEWAGPGFLLALIPTCFAIGFSLIRMIWTMPPARAQVPWEQPKPQEEIRPAL
jgi:hypothetical protein